jgi:hypothetical protein
LVAVAAAALLAAWPRELPKSVWTDGVRVCDAPGGTPVDGGRTSATQFFQTRSDGKVEPIEATSSSTPPRLFGPGTRTTTVFVIEAESWIGALLASIRIREIAARAERLNSYHPVTGGDVRDAHGVTWWRCDLCR